MVRRFRPRVVAAWLTALIVTSPLLAGAEIRLCVGRGTGRIASDGSVFEQALAGGTSAQVSCSTDDDVCFDVSSPRRTTRTRGGAGPSVGATPGILRAETTTAGQVYEIPGEATIVTRGSLAQVDRVHLMSGSFGGASITFADGSSFEIDGGPASCDSQQVTDFPDFRVIAGRTNCAFPGIQPGNLLEIVVEGLVIERPPGLETVLDRSAAGVEIPFVAGSGGCRLADDAKPAGLGDLLPSLTLLAWLARRRARPRSVARR